MPESAEIR